MRVKNVILLILRSERKRASRRIVATNSVFQQPASAGSRPAGEVQPLAVELLSSRGLPIDGLGSKSWEAFAALPVETLDAAALARRIDEIGRAGGTETP